MEMLQLYQSVIMKPLIRIMDVQGCRREKEGWPHVVGVFPHTRSPGGSFINMFLAGQE